VTARTQRRMTATERREQLLDAAKALVDAQGFHAVSMEAVARAAGITRPIVYHHFPGGLGDLLVALVERETARALDQLAQMLTGRSVDLLASLEAYLDAVAADPATWRLVLTTPEGTPEVLRGQVQEARDRFAQALARVEDLHAPDPELTGVLLQALADEAARLLLAGRYDRERLVAQARWLIGSLRTAS
jgi:AcrR family transcriptional regulator